MVLRNTLESPLTSKEIKPVNPKGNWPWIFTGGTDAEILILLATWREKSTHWKRPWCWERLKAKREKVGRGWDGWIASPAQRTMFWANSGRQWGTRRTGVLQSTESQRTGHDLATEQKQEIGTKYTFIFSFLSGKDIKILRFIRWYLDSWTQSCWGNVVNYMSKNCG